MTSDFSVIATDFFVREWEIPTFLLQKSKESDLFATDIATNLIVAKLSEHNIDLIDIRSLGSSSMGINIDIQTIQCLSNEKLSDSLLDEITVDLEKLGAQVLYRVETYQNPVMKFDCYPVIWQDPDCQRTLETLFFKVNSRVPRLSDGPLDGKYSSSWNNALSTEEARDWVVKRGIPVERIRTVSIRGESGQEHTIGFVRNSLY